MIVKIIDKLSGAWTLRNDSPELYEELQHQADWLDHVVVSNGVMEDHTPLGLKLLFGYG